MQRLPFSQRDFVPPFACLGDDDGDDHQQEHDAAKDYAGAVHHHVGAYGPGDQFVDGLDGLHEAGVCQSAGFIVGIHDPQQQLDEMDLEADTKKAIGNNTTLIEQRISAKGKTTAGVEARLGVLKYGHGRAIFFRGLCESGASV